MPYKLSKKDGKWCVLNSDTGDNKGCSDTRAMAVKHMRALYANSEGKSKGWHPDAAYLNEYISYLDGLVRSAQYSFQYEDSEHEELAAFSERLIDMASEGIEQLVMWRNQWYGTPESLKEAGIAETVIDAIKKFLKPEPEPAPNKQGAGLVLTKQNDRLRVLLRVSNNFKDRHDEIITEAAHKEYEAYVKESGNYPEFWLWHTPGSRWGQADLVDYSDGFLTMSGLVDVGKEYIAEGLVERGKDIGVSHGFKAINIQGKGYIDWYRTFEASPLPISEAANIWTGMMLAKEWEMGLAEKQRKFFQAIGVPESVLTEWDNGSKSLADSLKQAGIEFKEVAEDVATVATETETETPPVESDVLAELKKLNARFDSLEQKQKELETITKDAVANTLEAAIVPGAGAGFVASKQGETPTTTETDEQKKWSEELASLIVGEARS